MAVSSIPPAQTATSTQNDAPKHHTHEGHPPEATTGKTGVKNTSEPKLATSGPVGTKLNQVA